LYEMLLKDCQNLGLSTSKADTNAILAGKDMIKPVGFGSEEGILPYPSSSFIGYRLLTEFFVFPEKYMFIEIQGLANLIPANATDELNLYIYLNRSDVELEHNISADSFVLGCTPIVNLFSHRADPIKVD